MRLKLRYPQIKSRVISVIKSTVNNNIVSNERLKGVKDFLPKIKNKTRWATFTTAIQHCTEGSSQRY